MTGHDQPAAQKHEQAAKDAIANAEHLHKQGNLSGAIREYERAAALRKEARSAACVCGHPLSDHQTPGAECCHSALDCGCVTFRESPAATCRHCGRPGSGYRREPDGYVAWFDFAAAMTRKGYAQERCPGCGRFTVWVKQKVAA